MLKAVSLFTLLALAGCSGVEITPITPDEAGAAHAGGSRPGYIVHAPMLVVEITDREVCVKQDGKGKCIAKATRCAVGDPFAVPDYERPFRVNVRNGLGKAGVELTFTDGWMLGKVKDTPDNSSIPGNLLDVLKDASGLLASTRSPDADGGCPAAGLYRLVPASMAPDGQRGDLGIRPLKLYDRDG